MVDIYSGILFGYKKMTCYLLQKMVQLEDVIASEINQKLKDKYHMLSHMWMLKKNLCEFRKEGLG